ncbi:MAG: hypothetical protein ACXACC_05060 [Promethearchaeota archaeon]|jgi:predicted Mrr-cat superfamily restriction endonuclease
MVRYWIIAPYDSTEKNLFDTAWKYDIKNKTIAVGWMALGDILKIQSKDDLRKKYNEIYPDVKPSSATRDINTIWSFYHDILPGDKIIARRGTKKMIGIRTVTRKAFYNEDMGKERIPDEHYYSNFIKVEWENKIIDFDGIAFSFYTMYEITPNKYNSLLNGKTSEEDEEITEG